MKNQNKEKVNFHNMFSVLKKTPDNFRRFFALAD